ncbi:MAG: hypothetical protein FWD34_05165 [Oscillospiraceae bacterium]|nr:hypothetical protein [Oscillospiraceae bacterium]
MEHSIKKMFDVAPSMSNEEYFNRVISMTAEKTKQKPVFRLAYIPAVAMCLVLAVILFGNLGDVSHIFGNTELPTGRYMHESGDSGKYIEVFDDGTLQVFGFDYEQWNNTQPLPIKISSEEFAELTQAYGTRGHYSVNKEGQISYSVSETVMIVAMRIENATTLEFMDGMYTLY